MDAKAQLRKAVLDFLKKKTDKSPIDLDNSPSQWNAVTSSWVIPSNLDWKEVSNRPEPRPIKDMRERAYASKRKGEPEEAFHYAVNILSNNARDCFDAAYAWDLIAWATWTLASRDEDRDSMLNSWTCAIVAYSIVFHLTKIGERPMLETTAMAGRQLCESVLREVTRSDYTVEKERQPDELLKCWNEKYDFFLNANIEKIKKMDAIRLRKLHGWNEFQLNCALRR